MIKKFALIIGVSMLFFAEINAQSITVEPGLYLGPQVGYQKSADADNGSVMFGAALRAKLAPILGVEASINYRQEDYAGETITVKSWPVMVTGLIYPLPIVYGAVGAGWYNTTFDYNVPMVDIESKTKQEFGWHFGAGVELPVSERAMITGDIKYVFLNYDWEEVPGIEDSDANFYIINVGVLFGL
jgi:opacity protein-like surface antigen